MLVAAFWGDHASHDVSLELFAHSQKESAACGIHSLAEVYAAITALPVRPVLAPEQVVLFVEQIPTRLTTITLDETEYMNSIREIGERGLAGGRIYDGLLLACARKSEAETIYTWNLKHFRQLAPDLAQHIRTP